MQKIHYSTLLIVLLMLVFSVQSMHIEESHNVLKGKDPSSGFTIEYGCYKSNCWRYCFGLDKMWCWTNTKENLGKKSCKADKDCNGFYSKCVSACGL
jgi:hypothetical protein